jgi:hypothetical protein
MNIFTRMLARVTGRPVREVGMTVSHDGRTSPGELSMLANLTKRLFGSKFKFGSPGKPNIFLTTADIDPKTKKLYPDYMERRKREGSPRVIVNDEDIF